MTRNEGNGDGRWLALGSMWRDGEKHGGGGRDVTNKKSKNGGGRKQQALMTKVPWMTLRDNGKDIKHNEER